MKALYCVYQAQQSGYPANCHRGKKFKINIKHFNIDQNVI